MLHRHRHLTAWLGVLAIWFAIAAPLVSQWRVAQAATPDAIVCSTEHGAHPSPDAGRMHDHALHLDACGYCGFFAHTRDRRASRRGTRFHSRRFRFRRRVACRRGARRPLSARIPARPPERA